MPLTLFGGVGQVERSKGARKGPCLSSFLFSRRIIHNVNAKGARKGLHPSPPNPRLYYDYEGVSRIWMMFLIGNIAQ